MKCPNGCGELIDIEKPAEVFTDPNIYGYIPEWDMKNVAQECVFCYQILKICPKCGFVETYELTEVQWNRINEKQKKEDI